MKQHSSMKRTSTRQRTCPPIGGSISHRKYGNMTKSQNHIWKVCVKIVHATYYRFYISLLSIRIFKHVQIHSLKQNWNFVVTFFQFYEMWCVRVPLTFWLLRSLLYSINMYYLFTLKFVFSCFFVMSPYFQQDMLPPMGGPVLWRVPSCMNGGVFAFSVCRHVFMCLSVCLQSAPLWFSLPRQLA